MTRTLRNLKFFGYGFLSVALFALALNSCSTPAYADIVTEFGVGYKLPQTTSYVLRPECHTVVASNSAHRELASCGGDNPAFIGWPIAWERTFDRPWRLRVGWFHFSHWGDGGKDRETHMDAAVVSVTRIWRRRD